MRLSAIQGIDFHCHLDLYPDFPERVRGCDEAGIVTLAVTTTPQAFVRNAELANNTSFVRAALGLHPQLVATRSNEISLFEELLPLARFVGEVGLDASPAHYAFWTQQKEVFSEVLRLCAITGDKILSVHSVRCAGHVLDAIECLLPSDRGRVVLHWFTGSGRELSRAAAMGCYFSVNEAMLRSARSRELVRAIPTERLLTESDGPFQQIDGRAAQPLDMPRLTSELGILLGVQSDALSETLRKNLIYLLRE
jgi:TatD DNase family protein